MWSKEYSPFLPRTATLTEEHDASTRSVRIAQATGPGRITIMSSIFGKGTDFVILNHDIKVKGGLHIIQAFLS
jgi:preprotein translocase subunit SecA